MIAIYITIDQSYKFLEVLTNSLLWLIFDDHLYILYIT
jgi:hypothetical protein